MTDAPLGLPGRHAIESYGAGGFRFGGMSHRGSLLALPSGVYPWSTTTPAEIDIPSLAQVFAEADAIDHLLVGTGAAFSPLDPKLTAACKRHKITVEPMATAAAARTYNILIGERRRAAVALIAP